MTAHPNGTPSFAQQPIVFATTNNPGQAQQYYHAHPHANIAFPFFFTPPFATIPSSTPGTTNTATITPTTPESPVFPYPTTTGATTYSA